MDKQLKLKELEEELTEMRRSNHSLWNNYGSELCAGEMFREEDKLQNQIDNLKKEINQELASKNIENPSRIVDD